MRRRAWCWDSQLFPWQFLFWFLSRKTTSKKFFVIDSIMENVVVILCSSASLCHSQPLKLCLLPSSLQRGPMHQNSKTGWKGISTGGWTEKQRTCVHGILSCLDNTLCWSFLLASCLQHLSSNVVRDGVIRIIVCQERGDSSGQQVLSVREHYLSITAQLRVLSGRDTDSTPAPRPGLANCDCDISIRKSILWLWTL